ncbi:mechanosensitive ion channel family protein [Pantanalinema rosaneae CENA516]|uniref:mechanosensitive ion channel family protein n=1 Tax=Pantanalinema rosaneae TaxID=1620701 RepID=UPI003D6FCFAB
MRRSQSHSARWQTVCAIGISLWFTLVLLLAPGMAQTPDKATVVLDGQPIFQVNASGEYTARERAALVNLQLKEAVESTTPIELRVEQRNNQPTILLNDRHLLTVTNLDAGLNSAPTTQAEIWVRTLQNSLQTAQAERQPNYLRNAIVIAVIITIIVIALSWVLGRLRYRFAQTIHRRLPVTETGSPSPEVSTSLEVFSKLLLAFTRIMLWGTTALYIANLFPFTRRWSYQISSILLTSFTAPVLTLDQAAYSLTDLLILGALLFGVVVAARILTDFLKSRVLTVAGINRGAQEAIAILTKYSLITLGVLVLLQLWGLNISSLAILASALGIGIGFGLQDIAKNFVSGLVLVFERPVQVGDFIELENLKGTVERIGARSTEVKTLDQVSIIVPNSRFLQQEVINWSHHNPLSRLHLPVGVSYHADPEVVRSALLEAAQHHESVLTNPPPHVFFKGFGDSALNFELLIWVREPQKQFAISSDLYFEIFAILHQQQIEIPFPQHDLHLRSGSLQLSPQLEAALFQLSQQFLQGNSLTRDGNRNSTPPYNDR